MNDSCVLVTGGAGYIGSHTVRHLQRDGRKVVVLDTLENGHRWAAGSAPLVVGSIAEHELVVRLVEQYGVEAVIHFAAFKAAGESVHDPGRYFHNNTAGALALLRALNETGVRRFVFSSTAAVYGTPTHVPVTEQAPLAPESPYGESKLMVERMLHWFDAAHDLRSVSLRYFNAAGASTEGDLGEDWSCSANLVPTMMRAVLGRDPELQVFGTDYPTPDGTAIRDYIHVDDLAAAHVLALCYLEGCGPTSQINLGTGTGSSVRKVIRTVERVSSCVVPCREVERRPGYPSRIVADNAKANAVLGWQPRATLDDIIQSAWRWHAAHPDGFAPGCDPEAQCPASKRNGNRAGPQMPKRSGFHSISPSRAIPGMRRARIGNAS